MWKSIKINLFRGNIQGVVHLSSMRMRERITSIKGSNFQSKIQLHPTGGFIQQNSAILKEVSPLSLLTLHCFILTSSLCACEPDPCQMKLKQELCSRCTPKARKPFMGISGSKSAFGLSDHVQWRHSVKEKKLVQVKPPKYTLSVNVRASYTNPSLLH